MCSVGVCSQYQLLLLVSLFWPSKQHALLLSQQLGSCSLWKVSQGALLVLKQTPLHVTAHVLKHIYDIVRTLIHHLHQEPTEVIIAGTLKDISEELRTVPMSVGIHTEKT